MKVTFCLLFALIVFSCTQGAKIKNEKPTKDSNNDKATGALSNPSAVPQYITQFSQSLKFLSTFFRLIQTQITDTIANFNPSRPNPIFSALLANPSLIPFALRRLKEPIEEMIKIMDRIDVILKNTANNELSNNNELTKLLQQLQRRLQSAFGNLIPKRPHSDMSSRIPGLSGLPSIPTLFQNLNDFVSQFAQIFALFSQTVGNLINVNENPFTLNNRSTVNNRIDAICTRLQFMVMDVNSNSSQKLFPRLGLLADLVNGVGELFANSLDQISDTAFGAINDLDGGVVDMILNLLSGVFSSDESRKRETGSAPVASLLKNQNELRLRATSKLYPDFKLTSYGFVNKRNELIVANIMSKNINNNIESKFSASVRDNQLVLNRVSLNSMQSMMSSIVDEIKDTFDVKYMSALKCQIDGLGCSLTKEANDSEIKNCFKSLSNCISSYV